MKEKVKVSVIVPVYNVEKYLRQCLDSVVNQTLNEIEILCVNDGSTDSSKQILEEYSQKDERIKIINQKNKGLGAARNTGIEVATGEYVGFVDSDDWVKLDAYEKLYNNARSLNSDVVMSPVHVYDDTSKELKDDQPYFTLECFDKNFDNVVFNQKDTKDFLFTICVTAWNKIYKTEFLNEINARFPENILFEDNPFFYETYLKADNVSLIRDFLFYYRINRNDSIMSKKDSKFSDIIKIFEIVENIFIETNNKKEYKIALLNQVISGVWMRFCQASETYKLQFFLSMRQYFDNMDLVDDEINKLSLYTKNILQNIMNSDNYIEFKLKEEIKSLESNYKNQLANQERAYTTKLNDQRRAYEEKLNSKELIIINMSSSNSWKLTKLLRIVGKEIKRFK